MFHDQPNMHHKLTNLKNFDIPNLNTIAIAEDDLVFTVNFYMSLWLVGLTFLSKSGWALTKNPFPNNESCIANQFLKNRKRNII